MFFCHCKLKILISFGDELLNQVCCDGCNVWVHAECAKVSTQHFKVKYCRKYSTMYLFLWIVFWKVFLGHKWGKINDCFWLQDLENTDYYCPDCKEKSNCKVLASQTYKSKIKYVMIICSFPFLSIWGVQHFILFFESYVMMWYHETDQ